MLQRDLWHENAAVQRIGLFAARRCGDLAGQAHALAGLASCYARSGSDGDAQAVFASALAVFEKVDGHASRGRIHSQLGWLAERRQQPAEMLGHCQQALALYQVAGHRPGEAVTLNDVGYSHAMVGDYRQAFDFCQRSLAALAELGELGELGWEDAVWDSLGYIHHRLGNYREAISCYRRSVVLCRQVADRYNEAATLDHLGDVEFSAGDQSAAARSWASALDIFTEIDHPDGDLLRLKLLERELSIPA
jgi:tetratricopeptide (TPR) repeat protein